MTERTRQQRFALPLIATAMLLAPLQVVAGEVGKPNSSIERDRVGQNLALFSNQSVLASPKNMLESIIFPAIAVDEKGEHNPITLDRCIERARKLFSALDANGDGVFDEADLRSDARVEQMFRDVDKDRDGLLSREELEVGLAERAIATFIDHGRGLGYAFLSEKTIKSLVHFPIVQAVRLIMLTDRNSDGLITRAEALEAPFWIMIPQGEYEILIASTRLAGEDPVTQARFEGIARRAFTLMDQDVDGVVTAAEMEPHYGIKVPGLNGPASGFRVDPACAGEAQQLSLVLTHVFISRNVELARNSISTSFVTFHLKDPKTGLTDELRNALNEAFEQGGQNRKCSFEMFDDGEGMFAALTRRQRPN